MIPELYPHTEALLSRLRTTDLLVDAGRAPVGGGWQGAPGQSVFATYLVLHGLNHLRSSPNASIGDSYDAPVLRYQITSVGQDVRAVETASDLACRALFNRVPLDIPGRSTVLLVHETTVPAQRDESLNPPLFYLIDRFRLDTQGDN